MAILKYTEATGGLPNSGRLSGTDGDLVGILDVALVAGGWAIEYTSGNDRVYRPASGNRFRMTVRDGSAFTGSATVASVHGAENASSATAYTDPFPLNSQVADTNVTWLKSSTANTTARNFNLYVAPTWVAMFVNFSSTTNVWESTWWGDVPPAIAGDSYNTMNIARINQTATAGGLTSALSSTSNGNTRSWWTRSYDGTVKSSCGALSCPVGFAALGSFSNFPQARLGPTGGVDRCKVTLMDTGALTTANSTTKGIGIRGFLPNVWLPLHGGPGTINSRDTFTDTAYNASATFIVFISAAGNTWIIFEESDTWSPPGT